MVTTFERKMYCLLSHECRGGNSALKNGGMSPNKYYVPLRGGCQLLTLCHSTSPAVTVRDYQ